MSHRILALVPAVLLAALVACAEHPSPKAAAVVEPPRASAPRAIASFEVTIEPPTRGPGLGSHPGRALWTIIPEGQDGQPGTNPPRTVEIVSTAPFAEMPAGDLGLPPGCETGALWTPVRITNYLPERLAALFVTITFLSDVDRAICNPGVLPAGGTFDWDPVQSGSQDVLFDPPAGATSPYGSYLDYVNVNAYPMLSLAAAPGVNGQSPGGVSSLAWYFSFPTGSSGFTVRGKIWAEPFPNPPRIGGETWGGFVEQGETLGWFVYDNKDDKTKFEVSRTRASICTQAFAADGTCGGTESVLDDTTPPSNGFVDSNARGFGWGSYTTPTPGTLTVGQRYYFRGVANWDPGSGFIDGSFPLLQDFVITGTPQLQTPADLATDIPLSSATAFTWKTDYPFATTVLDFQDDMLIICDVPDCSGTTVSLSRPTTNAVEGPANTWTYTVNPDLSGLAAGTTYYWSARNKLPFRNGSFAPGRSFTTAP